MGSGLPGTRRLVSSAHGAQSARALSVSFRLRSVWLVSSRNERPDGAAVGLHDCVNCLACGPGIAIASIDRPISCMAACNIGSAVSDSRLLGFAPSVRAYCGRVCSPLDSGECRRISLAHPPRQRGPPRSRRILLDPDFFLPVRHGGCSGFAMAADPRGRFARSAAGDATGHSFRARDHGSRGVD